VNNENGMGGVSFSRKEPPFETDQSACDFFDEEISAAVQSGYPFVLSDW